MAEKTGRLNFLLAEARRRHVFRVAGAYVIACWVVLQIGDVVFPPLLVPGWVMTVLVVLAAVGLPVVVILAWMFDVTPQGVVRTEPRGGGEAGEAFHWNTRWIDYVIILALLVILAFVLKRGQSDDQPPGQSIAVLPFADLSTDGQHRYFCDGMSEALIDSLSGIPELMVASRTSSFAYRDSSVDVREVADKLGVSAILEGSVRKSGNEVRIDARLVNGRNGFNIWSESYEGTLEDIFSLQDKIARAIVNVLEVKLLEPVRLVETATRDQDAYDLYLRGRAELREKGTLEDLAEAIDFFERSLERDPVFALAMAGLCTARWWEYEITRDSEQAERAISTCKEATVYDSHAETHVALGGLYRNTGQYEKARAVLERALEMEPRNADALAARGNVRRLEGDLQAAEKDILRAIELDPEYWRHYSDLGNVYYFMGRLDKAREQFSRAISFEPGSPIPYTQLGGILALKGENLKASDAFRKSIARGPTAVAYSNAATNYYFAEAFEEAEEMYREAIALNPSDYPFHGNLAHAIALQGGRADEARESFEKAVELAYERLAINPSDHLARSSVAIYLAKLGRTDAAREELRGLPAEGVLDAYVQHNQATTYLFLGEHDTAIEYFEKAIRGGYPPRLLKADPNLEPLTDDPAFQALIRNGAEEGATQGAEDDTD